MYERGGAESERCERRFEQRRDGGLADPAETEAREGDAELVSLTKAKLAGTAHLATTEAIQMHGGIGMTDEHEIGFFIKRARVVQHSFGDYNLDGQLDFITIGMSSTTARRLDKLGLRRDGFTDYDAKRAEMGYGNRLFLNRAAGFEQAPFNSTCARTGWSWGCTSFDFDRDGDQDI